MILFRSVRLVGSWMQIYTNIFLCFCARGYKNLASCLMLCTFLCWSHKIIKININVCGFNGFTNVGEFKKWVVEDVNTFTRHSIILKLFLFRTVGRGLSHLCSSFFRTSSILSKDHPPDKKPKSDKASLPSNEFDPTGNFPFSISGTPFLSVFHVYSSAVFVLVAAAECSSHSLFFLTHTRLSSKLFVNHLPECLLEG